MLFRCLKPRAATSAFALLIAVIAAEAAALEVGTKLTYVGSLEPAGLADDASAREFRVTFLVAETTQSGGAVLHWIVEEQSGSPRWHWAQRFGTVQINSSKQPTNDRELPAIQAERDGSVRAIPIKLPYFPATDRLKANAEWDDNQLHYEVVGQEAAGTRRCWKVTIANEFGVREIDWVDEKQGIVAKHRQAVFLGQGVPHELAIDLDRVETLAGDDLQKQRKAHGSLVALRGPVEDKLSESEKPAPNATPELLERAKSTQAAVIEQLKTGAYADLAREAAEETKRTLDRDIAVGKLRESLIGKSAKTFSLPTTRGATATTAELKGKPIVLHFWEYKAEPKIAPYGETGYLDFLARQREKQGVRVIGIAVDPRLSDPATRNAARKEVRAFCDFMNLSYPVAFDEQGIIDSFGDPRKVGAKLPLYIVIAPDGKIAEYRAGLWGSTADEGLKELDQRLQKMTP